MKKSFLCNFRKAVVLSFFLLTACFLNAQKKLQFGVNSNFDNPVFLKMVYSNEDYKSFFKDFNIDYIRFPGGSPVRFFIYNSSDLSQQAKNQLFKTYMERGKKTLADKSPNTDFANFTFPADYYDKFLKFCVANNVKPMIQLNTFFYVSGGQIKRVATLRSEQKGQMGKAGNDISSIDNVALRQYILSQLKQTHTVLSNVLWEIGNEEDFFYTPETEAKIVSIYLDVIKTNYPQDKVIVSFSNSMKTEKGEKNQQTRITYNQTFVSELQKYNLLNKIDYFAPHFYYDVDSLDRSDENIQRRIRDIDFAGSDNHFSSFFPKTYTPHFFYTEYSIYQGNPAVNPNFNSNLHALFMFYFLMNFYASPHLSGVVYHSFLGRGPFMFMQSDAQDFNNNIVNKSSSYADIAVIPIQSQIEKVFYQNVGDVPVSLVTQGDLKILTTQSNGKYSYFIINLSPRNVTISKDKIFTAAPTTTWSYINYDFQDLMSKTNVLNSKASQAKYSDVSSLVINKYSILVIK